MLVAPVLVVVQAEVVWLVLPLLLFPQQQLPPVLLPFPLVRVLIPAVELGRVVVIVMLLTVGVRPAVI